MTASTEGTVLSEAPDAPAAARVLERARGENFTVASRLLPAAAREGLMAIYGFARMVDDIGDEAAGDRIALLDWAERELDAVYGGEPAHPLMRRLQPVVERHRIPPEPFRALIEANRVDQEVTSYRSFDDLLGYCRLSANPVGRLVLYVFGLATPERFELSDRICSGLQVVEHLQDVSEDHARGRVYLPQEDLERFGASVDDIPRSPSPEPLRAVVSAEARLARELVVSGLPLVRTLPGRLGLAVAGFAGGGLAGLAEIERRRFDVSQRVPPAPPLRRARWIAFALARARRTLSPVSRPGRRR